MPKNDKHGILLNLEADLHAEVTSAAKANSVSVTEWVKRAIRMRLDKPEPAPVDLFSVTPAEAESNRDNGKEPVEIPPIQTPDKRNPEYWLDQIRQWAQMPGAEAMARLDAATNGIRPPAELFGSAGELAQWLTENAD